MTNNEVIQAYMFLVSLQIYVTWILVRIKLGTWVSRCTTVNLLAGLVRPWRLDTTMCRSPRSKESSTPDLSKNEPMFVLRKERQAVIHVCSSWRVRELPPTPGVLAWNHASIWNFVLTWPNILYQDCRSNLLVQYMECIFILNDISIYLIYNVSHCFAQIPS